MKIKFVLAVVSLLALPIVSQAQLFSKGGKKKSGVEEKKEGDSKPKIKQELSTRSSDEGRINGIAFSYTQSAYEFDGSSIQEDTLFFLHSNFVIDIDVLPFKIGGETYVRMVYAPYSNGEQRPAGTYMRKEGVSPVIFPIKGINGKVLCMRKVDFDSTTKILRYSSGICHGWQLTSGQLTVPFKLRPMRTFGEDTLAPFKMTTDVTIGVYAGPRVRLSWKHPDLFLTFPVTAGLTFVNVSSSTTSLTQPDGQVAEIVPGFSWSLGVIFQYRRTNFGFVMGRDYASDYARKWIYHNDPWYSFAIGYSFLGTN